ncbi:MAG: hypothetical protein C4297_12230 [Gemmataceae bacterium]
MRKWTHLLVTLALSAPAWGQDSKSLDLELSRKLAVSSVPVERIPARYREEVRRLLQEGWYQHGRWEAFLCEPKTYEWILDHPEQAARGWQNLGAVCASVHKDGDGVYSAQDRQGNTIVCHLVLHQPGRRMWLVEGKAVMVPLLPPVSYRAAVLLEYEEVTSRGERLGIRHRAEVFVTVQASGASGVGAAWAKAAFANHARALLDQIQLFFSGVSWYASTHPSWAEKHLYAAEESLPSVR